MFQDYVYKDLNMLTRVKVREWEALQTSSISSDRR
jgi:hypothetical protein